MIAWLSIFLSMYMLFVSVSIAEENNNMETLTLAEAVESALQQNPQILARRYDVKAALSEQDELHSTLFPQIAFENQFNNSESDRFGASLENAGFAGETYINRFRVTQSLFDYQIIGGIKQARLREEAAKWQLTGQKQDTVLQVIHTYLHILRAQELLAVQQQRLEFVSKQKRMVENNFQAGYRIQTDVTRAQLEYTKASQDVRRAKHNVERAFVELNLEMGKPVQTRYQMQSQYLGAYSPPNGIEHIHTHTHVFYQLIEQQNPTLRIAALVVEQFLESVQMAKAERLPNVSVGGNWGFFDRGHPNFDDEEWNVNLAVSVPVFTSGRIRAKTERLHMQYASEQKRYESHAANLRGQVEGGILTLLEEKDNLDMAEEALSVAEQNYENHLNLFESGMIPTVEVMQALTEYMESKTDVVLFRYSFMRVAAQLQSVLGLIPLNLTEFQEGVWLEQYLSPELDIEYAGKSEMKHIQTEIRMPEVDSGFNSTSNE